MSLYDIAPIETHVMSEVSLANFALLLQVKMLHTVVFAS